MQFGVEIRPFVLHRMIAFHLVHGLGPLKTALAEAQDEIVKNQGVGTFLAIFGQHGNHQQVDRVGFVPLQHL